MNWKPKKNGTNPAKTEMAGKGGLVRTFYRVLTWTLLALIFPSFIALPAMAQAAQTSGTTVSVTGRGATEEAARLDAIRQATQLVTRQLIVADRQIANDDLVMDRVIATMNGYVERFESLDSHTELDEYVISARVTIAESRISNFISTEVGAGGDVDGDSLFAEVQRSRSQKESTSDLIRRALSGFPANVLNVELKRVRMLDSDRHKSLALLDVLIKPDPEWVSSLSETLKEVSERRFTLPRRGSGFEDHYGGPRDNTGCLVAPANTKNGGFIYVHDTRNCRDTISAYNAAKEVSGVFACVLFDKRAECFLIPEVAISSLQYAISSPYDPELLFLVDFIDGSGNPVHRDEECTLSHGMVGKILSGNVNPRDGMEALFLGISGVSDALVGGSKRIGPVLSLGAGKNDTSNRQRTTVIDSRTIAATIVVDVGNIDLSRTKGAVFYPVIGDHQSSGIEISDVALDRSLEKSCAERMEFARKAYLRN